MARKRRSKRPDPREMRRGRPVPMNPGWRWRTLPVFLALTGGFLAGWYVASWGTGVMPAPWSWAYITQFVVLIGFSFGLSRITSWLMARWMVSRRAKAARQAAPSRPSKGSPAPPA